MSSRPIHTPVTSRPQSPLHHQRHGHHFAGSSYTVDILPSRSQSRAKPAAALPDLEVDDVLTRRPRPREPSESTYPQRGIGEDVTQNTVRVSNKHFRHSLILPKRFQLLTDVYPSSRILGHPTTPSGSFDNNTCRQRSVCLSVCFRYHLTGRTWQRNEQGRSDMAGIC